MGDAVSKAAGVVLVGFGAIGGAVAALLHERGQAGRIAAVGLRGGAPPRAGLPPGVPILSDPGQLAGVGAGLMVEVAGRAAVAPWGRAALGLGLDFAVSSVSAFADAALLDELTEAARRLRARLIIPPARLAASMRCPLQPGWGWKASNIAS